MIDFKNVDKDDKEFTDSLYESSKGLNLVEVQKIVLDRLNENKLLAEQAIKTQITTLVLHENDEEEEVEEECEDKGKDKDKKKVEEENPEDPEEPVEESLLYASVKEYVDKQLAEKKSSSNDDNKEDDPTKKPKPDSKDNKGKGTENPEAEDKNDPKKGTGKTGTKTKSDKGGAQQVPENKSGSLKDDFTNKLKDDDHKKKED